MLGNTEGVCVQPPPLPLFICLCHVPQNIKGGWGVELSETVTRAALEQASLHRWPSLRKCHSETLRETIDLPIFWVPQMRPTGSCKGSPWPIACTQGAETEGISLCPCPVAWRCLVREPQPSCRPSEATKGEREATYCSIVLQQKAKTECRVTKGRIIGTQLYLKTYNRCMIAVGEPQ